MMYKTIRTPILLIKFWIIWWNTCHVISDKTVCSEYLVSGLYGVEDSALTASSVWQEDTITNGPQHSRLHFDGNFRTTFIPSAWVSSTSDDQQYIQVRFPRKTEVDGVMIQGRKDYDISQWVETYYVMYSIDGITWTTVASESQQPRSMPHKVPTHVTSSLIVVRHPDGCSEYHRLPMLPSPGFEQHVAFETQSDLLPKCGQQCHKAKTCLAFSFDINQRICRGFNSALFDPIYPPFSAGFTPFFVNEGILKSLGYRQILDGDSLYRVNEIRMNQTRSADICKQQYSQLIKVDSESIMLSLQNIIAGNTILKHDNSQLLVSGMYVSLQWKYSDGEQINSALWSPGNPDPNQGHCVMLTQTGLKSVACTESLFSICGMSWGQLSL